nr:site-specific DNA-methyltransferase [Candidatus Njordarchaeota archaeon]
MSEIDDNSIQLMITSPPYPMVEMWDHQFRLMDGEIDRLWGEMNREEDSDMREKTLGKVYDLMHENLARVWRETYRVLSDGGLACINIGDATRNINGVFRLFPNHAKVVEHCERIGFLTLPYILWKKPTTKPKYKGKGAFLGSGMLPPNAYVTLDCEFILVFRKGGPRRFAPKDPVRYESKYTKQERDTWFTQIWDVTGARQSLSQVERRAAAFPEEIPRRLMRMFSVVGDTVFDPFLGTGTTLRVAIELGRNMIGYEVDKELRKMIENGIDTARSRFLRKEVELVDR